MTCYSKICGGKGLGEGGGRGGLGCVWVKVSPSSAGFLGREMI